MKINERDSAMLGLPFSLAMLNNLEFGGTAALSAVVTLLVLRRSMAISLRSVAAFIAGMLLPLLAYAFFGYVFESKVVARNVLLLPLTFASSGFGLKPIESIGPFLIVVMLALTSIVLGIYRLRSGGRRALVSGVVLTFAGVWSLLSMIYFVGRSFTSVLIAGQGVQVALMLGCLAVFLPASGRAIRLFGMNRARLLGLGIVLLPLFVSISLLVGGGRPQGILAYGLSGQPVDTRFPEIEEALSVVKADPGWETRDKQYVGLLTENSARAASEYGVLDVSSSTVGYVSGSLAILRFQCESLRAFRFLVIDHRVHDSMTKEPVCKHVLDQGHQVHKAEGETKLIVYAYPPP